MDKKLQIVFAISCVIKAIKRKSISLLDLQVLFPETMKRIFDIPYVSDNSGVLGGIAGKLNKLIIFTTIGESIIYLFDRLRSWKNLQD